MAFAFIEGAEGKEKDVLGRIDDRIKSFGWNFQIVVYWVASLYALSGEKDEAFRWLDRSIAIGNRNYRWFEVDPNLAGLRGDTRFPLILNNARRKARDLKTKMKMKS
jgi:hypothetical protein